MCSSAPCASATTTARPRPAASDLYKRGCFVLEAKQSKKREKGGEVYEQLAFALESGRGTGVAVLERPRAKGNARPQLSTWDALMRSARKQAENYARALDEWPPFLVVADVGHVIELYADFSRQGKNYAQFPDRNSFRVSMADLRSPETRERLKAVWEDPFSLDPGRHAAEVTQDVAALLAKMTQSMERRARSDDPVLKGEWAFKVSKFLMRCIFAMFAEDIGLLSKGAFLKLIEQHKSKANRFHFAANDFFATMDKGGYSPAIQQDIKKFNGGLFREAISVEITEDELTLLEKAARRDWRAVEPAIFGTLLEQALTERDRSKLGAHYTPRAYVERLVVPTIIEPLRDDWDVVQSEAIGKLLDGDDKGARWAVRKFHDRLCDTRVLDPACGTGNFLYVSMELMKRLEGEVLDFLKELGETSEPLRTVDPHQFLGIERNPRAAPIAELVLWIGYIQWWFRTRERQVLAEPILKDFGTVKIGDAVLAYDRQELLRDEHGRPITRQDPNAVKLHPVTGEEIPDPDAKLEVYRYVNSRPTQWPEAEFVIGNPPFIGNKRSKQRLGEDYVSALRGAYSGVPRSVDYVMYWWFKFSEMLKARRIRNFGLITTNSIIQPLNRPGLEYLLEKDPKCNLVFTIPDHPWVDVEKGAAVRVAMLVAQRGNAEGKLVEIVTGNRRRGNNPVIGYREERGHINVKLRIGLDTTKAVSLLANKGVSHQGVILVGEGFRLTPVERSTLVSSDRTYDLVIRPYRIGNDLTDRPEDRFVIDANDIEETTLRSTYPRAYQILLDRVKPERDVNNDKAFRESWWKFGRRRPEIVELAAGRRFYIATCRTARYRVFVLMDASIVPDAKIIFIGLSDAYYLGILSSNIHVTWSLASGAWLGVGNDSNYNHSECFEPFPFPNTAETLKQRIRELGDELDGLRKRVLQEHEFLTITKLYSVREKLQSGALLNESEKAIHDAGCVGVIHELHNKIDAAVAEAYGWPADLSDDDILGRLVALNKERAEEEKRGIIRWLRPDYQATRARTPTAKEEQIEANLELPEAAAPELPRDDAALVATLRQTLRVIGKPAEAKDIAQRFRDGARGSRRVERGLNLLAAAGVVRRSNAGWFLPSDRAA
jgi:hypothetical protein